MKVPYDSVYADHDPQVVADGQAGQEVPPAPSQEGHAAGPACSAPDEEYPPVGHPLQELGARLADLLQSDHFNNIEPMLLAVWEELKRARAAPDNSLIDEIANQYWDRGVAEVAIREYIRRSAGKEKG